MMKNKKKEPKRRNWGLVFISSILILLGIALCIIAIAYAGNLGWRGIFIGLGGLATTGAGVMSIVTNDPRWILLDLIIPY